MQEYFISNPYFYSLALTLIHFIWQGGLVALALKTALVLTSQKKPQLRYAFASLAMLSCLILPFITFAVIYQPDNLALSFSSSLIPILNTASTGLSSNNFYWPTNIIEFLPYISMVWLSIVMLLTFKLLIEIFMVNQLPKQSVHPVDAKLAARFIELVERVKLTTTPRLLISLKTDVPMAIGWLKPVILIPASMLSGLTTPQLEMLILHELAHIRRHDYLVNFIQTLVALLLFFHPAVQWISKQMRNEREYCSDDIAVQCCGDAIAYAHTLADTAALCSKHRHHTIPNMAMAASGGDLKQRVVRLVDHHCTPSNDVGKWLAATTVIVSILGFSSQQFLTPGLFEMGSAKQKAEPLEQNEFINYRNYQQASIAKTSIARQLLTSEASYPNNINIEAINTHNLTVSESTTTELTKNVAEETVANKTIIENVGQQASITKQQPSLSVVENRLYAALESSTPTNIEAKLVKTEFTNELTTSSTTEQTTQSEHIASNSQEKSIVQFNQQPKIEQLTDNKSISTLAFERTDSSVQSSRMNNPYANQIAELNTPIIDDLNLLDSPVIESQLSSIDQSQSILTFDEQFIPSDNLVDLSLLAQGEQPLETLELVIDSQPFKAKAELIKGIDPKYPANAKRKGLELEVRVHFIIDKSGRIKNIEFEQQNKVSYFRNAIKTAMRKWSFHPATLDGQPVESTMSKIFSFSLTG